VLGPESLLIVRVYRGGTLARAGHNHIVASHDLSGTVYVATDLARSSFELELPVASLTVDEPELRAAQGADFAADVPDGARDGTRRNMLGPAVLDADHYPQNHTALRGLGLDASRLMAHVEIDIRGQVHTVTVPVSYTLKANELLAQGEFALKQTDLGLAPFTALLGRSPCRMRCSCNYASWRAPRDHLPRRCRPVALQLGAGTKSLKLDPISHVYSLLPLGDIHTLD
jgi:hypothetical protein